MPGQNNMLEDLKKYFANTPREQVEEDWAKSAKYNNVGPTVDEFIEFTFKFPPKTFSMEDMIEAAEYGYNFHKNTSFPEQEFEDSCIRNTGQWLTKFYDKYPSK